LDVDPIKRYMQHKLVEHENPKSSLVVPDSTEPIKVHRYYRCNMLATVSGGSRNIGRIRI
jgi:hypothetical protein